VNTFELRAVKSNLYPDTIVISLLSHGDAFNFYTKLCYKENEKDKEKYSITLGLDNAIELMEFLESTFPELKKKEPENEQG